MDEAFIDYQDGRASSLKELLCVRQWHWIPWPFAARQHCRAFDL